MTFKEEKSKEEGRNEDCGKEERVEEVQVAL